MEGREEEQGKAKVKEVEGKGKRRGRKRESYGYLIGDAKPRAGSQGDGCKVPKREETSDRAASVLSADPAIRPVQRLVRICIKRADEVP